MLYISIPVALPMKITSKTFHYTKHYKTFLLTYQNGQLTLRIKNDCWGLHYCNSFHEDKG